MSHTSCCYQSLLDCVTLPEGFMLLLRLSFLADFLRLVLGLLLLSRDLCLVLLLLWRLLSFLLLLYLLLLWARQLWGVA